MQKLIFDQKNLRPIINNKPYVSALNSREQVKTQNLKANGLVLLLSERKITMFKTLIMN